MIIGVKSEKKIAKDYPSIDFMFSSVLFVCVIQRIFRSFRNDANIKSRGFIAKNNYWRK